MPSTENEQEQLETELAEALERYRQLLLELEQHDEALLNQFINDHQANSLEEARAKIQSLIS